MISWVSIARLWYEFRNMKWDPLGENLYLVVVAYYFTLLFLGGFRFLASIFGEKRDWAMAMVLFFMLFNIVFIIAGSNFFAWIGSNRYRFTLEPFFLVLLGICITRMLRFVANKPQLD